MQCTKNTEKSCTDIAEDKISFAALSSEHMLLEIMLPKRNGASERQLIQKNWDVDVQAYTNRERGRVARSPHLLCCPHFGYNGAYILP